MIPGTSRPAAPGAVDTLSEVNDEILAEQIEVKVFATANFENCPDQFLSEDYLESLQKFILSENHLASNISNVKSVNLSSRKLRNHLYVHTACVEMTVKLENLCEAPCAYIYKHLGRSDWLRGNKTRITLTRIHE